MEKKKQISRQKSDIIDVRGLLQQYLSKWYLFAISVCFCCGLALIWARMHPPKYDVTANVLIDTEDSNPMTSMLGGLLGSSNYVDDEIFILSSHSLYVSVARELGLDRTREFNTGFLKNEVMYDKYPLDIIPPKEFADTARVGIAVELEVNDRGEASGKVIGPKKRKLLSFKKETLPLSLKTEYGTFAIVPTQYYVAGDKYDCVLSSESYDSAAEGLDESVESYIANKKTHVIRLQYLTDNTDFGKLLLNTIMAQYDERVISDKNVTNSRTIRFLDERIDQMGRDLAETEGQLQDFKENNNIVNLTADIEYDFLSKGELAKQLISAERVMELTGMTNEFLSTPGNEYALIPFAYAGNEANALIESYNRLAMERMKLLSTAKPDNVKVRELEMQLDLIRDNLVSTMQKNYDNSRIVVADLRKKMNEADASLGSVPANERRMYELGRDRVLRQKLYMFLLERREETAMLMTNTKSKGIVVDQAFVPSLPSTMGLKKLLAIAFILGIILPVCFLYLIKLLRGKPESRAEIESLLNIPILGEVSKSRSGKNLVVTPGSTSSAVELFKLMRANLAFMLKGGDHKVVMVTSSTSGEGKSFISINLAASLALQKKRVLLVGLDIRKPMLSTYLQLPSSHPGITSYLSDTSIRFDSLVQHVGEIDGLDVVVAGIVPPNPAEMLMDPHLADFFATARERYDYIIIDSAPVGMVSDSLSVAEYADATIYVTRVGATSFRDLKFINSLYEEDRLPSMSIVVNGTKATKGYGYGYGSVEDHGKNVHNTKTGFFSRLTGKK